MGIASLPPLLVEFQEQLTRMPGVGAADRFLLAVSGGLDSTVMADLFFCAGKNLALAHCNFQLRGGAADADEAFVQQLAQEMDAPFFVTHFATADYATAHHLSIQAAARQLRYNWLEDLRQEKGYDWIVTAHQANDNLETILYNLTKGTGLLGLLGIPPRNGAVLRPLLGFSREQLAEYAEAQELPYQTDASNAEVYYARNRIRHQVVPVLKTINPSVEAALTKNLPYLREVADFFEAEVQRIKALAWQERSGVVFFDLTALTDHPAATNVLFRLLRPLGFTSSQVEQLRVASANGQPGKLFFSPTHQLLVDRLNLVIEKKAQLEPADLRLDPAHPQLQLPEGRLQLHEAAEVPRAFPSSPHYLWLNPTGLKYPLRLRHWQAGDFFYPLGLGGKKRKLQDFFSDLKLDRFTKTRQWLLVDAADQILWIVGRRADERFRLPPDAATCTLVEWEPGIA